MKIVDRNDDAALPDAGVEAGAEAVCSMIPDTDTDHRAHTRGTGKVP